MKYDEKLGNDSYLGSIMTPEEQHEYFNEVCYRILHNTRFYLDHLDDLHVFRMSIMDQVYGKRHFTSLTKDNLYKGR